MITGSSVLLSLFQWENKNEERDDARSGRGLNGAFFISPKNNPRPGQNLVPKID